ncbi:MAG: hypothetical protein BMS9Abin28_0698 [Anaerolineae bacterium]|nr:MAG: hypothetical protein BMS9Abin28_0698 [Anaerolineae bacterium]
MGCGSVLGDLFYLADSLLQAPTPAGNSRPDAATSLNPTRGGGELLAQLYNMYGEGQISEEVFTALQALANRGQLRQADLAVHRAGSRHPRGPRMDQEVTNALRGIRSRLNQLAEARKGSERVLSNLEARTAEMAERMAAKERAARQALGEGDEQIARQRLAEKAELSTSRARLIGQAQALRDELARLTDLRSQLKAKALEMEAVLARGELASLDPIRDAKESA